MLTVRVLVMMKEEVGGHSCRDAFDFEENEEPWGAFI